MAGEPQAEGGADQRDRLYFFFSPDTGAVAARKVVTFAKAHSGAIDVRPVILVEDWSKIRSAKEDSPLVLTVRELGRLREPEGVDIRLFDEEGLRLAMRWKISRLPALVLVCRKRAHLIQGTEGDLDLLAGCER